MIGSGFHNRLVASSGFAARDARWVSLRRAESGIAAKNAGPVSGLGKRFPGRNSPVLTETGSTLARDWRLPDIGPSRRSRAG
jgi:hypothetical protein